MELKGYKNSYVAKELLDRLLKETDEIVKRRGWVFELREFLPEVGLEGINERKNNSVTISVRLRRHDDNLYFLEWIHIFGTFIHELCHMEVFNHGPKFKILEQKLYDEHDDQNSFKPTRYSIKSNLNKSFEEKQGRKLGGSKTGKSNLLKVGKKLGGNTNDLNLPANIMSASVFLAKYN